MDDFEIKEFLENKLNENDSIIPTGDEKYSNKPLYLGNIEYYLNPGYKIAEEVTKKGGSYCVTNEGQILMAFSKDLAEKAVFNSLKRFYDIDAENVGLISNKDGGRMIIPGWIETGLILTRDLYGKQIVKVNKIIKTLTKEYSALGLRLFPPVAKFCQFVVKVYKNKHSNIPQFEFKNNFRKTGQRYDV